MEVVMSMKDIAVVLFTYSTMRRIDSTYSAMRLPNLCTYEFLGTYMSKNGSF